VVVALRLPESLFVSLIPFLMLFALSPMLMPLNFRAN